MASSIGNFYEHGNQHLIEAIKLDQEGAIHVALKSYIMASTFMIKAMEYEKEEPIKAKLKNKIEDILTRCETLKTFITTAAIPVGDSSSPLFSTQGNNSIQENNNTLPKEKEVTKNWFITEKPNVSWDSVIGLGHVKQVIAESFQLPLHFPKLFQGNRKPWSGMLLYGPPGTGKTLIAKAMATQLDAEFINVKTADIVSKFQGDSEKQIKGLFEKAREYAKQKPVIIFVDEIDSLCTDRSLSSGGGDSASSANIRIVTQFLTEIDGIDSQNTNLFVIGATNLPWLLDTGILRRFPKRLYVALPNTQAREHMIRLFFSNNIHLFKDENFVDFAQRTEGYSGSDINNLTKEALMFPIKDIMNATEFFQNPSNDKFLPVLNHEDKISLIQMYGEAFQLRYKQTPHFINRKWQDLTNDTIDSEIPVTRKHFLESLSRSKPTANLAFLSKYTEWTREHAEQEMDYMDSSL